MANEAGISPTGSLSRRRLQPRTGDSRQRL